MTLTEEQRAALKRVAAYMDEMYSVASPYHGCTEDANLLRAMIDSSGTVEPTGGFDLERARGLRDFLQDDCAEVGDVWGEMIAEIERLRAENEEALESLTAAYLLGSHKKAQEMAARIKSLKKEIGRLKHESKVEQEFTNSYILHLHEAEARIKELEAELAEMHNCALEVAGFLAEKENLEAALVEERANKMIQADDCTQNQDAADFHHRCICEYNVKKCPIEQWWLDRARITLQAEGKIGPDAKLRSWQITEERKAALAAMSNLSETISCPDCGVWIGFADIGPHMAVLRAMLREAE